MASISEIKASLAACSFEELPAELEKWHEDERKGVKALVLSAQKRYRRMETEQKRMDALWIYERLCYEQGYQMVAGVDEVGRGPLAGPVMTAAVILPKKCSISGINDSKKLTPKKREELYDVIIENAVAYAFGSVSAERIDQINILRATLEAMKMAIDRLQMPPDFVLADALTIPRLAIAQQGIIKGDEKSISIGAASIIAKVERDRLMVEMDGLYPQYGFGENKGYGTKAHIHAIESYGLCPIHRRSFVKNIVSLPDGNKVAHNRQKGDEGEDIAVRQLTLMGYQILERNYRGYRGEIDIIAQKDGITVFIEVKYRKTLHKGLPREAVDSRKQQHIIQTAKQYMSEKQITGDCRFDVAEVTYIDGKKCFNYIENAFWA